MLAFNAPGDDESTACVPLTLQLAVKLCRARIAALEAAIVEAKAAGAEPAAAAAAAKEIGGLEDSLDGVLRGKPYVYATHRLGANTRSWPLCPARKSIMLLLYRHSPLKTRDPVAAIVS